MTCLYAISMTRENHGWALRWRHNGRASVSNHQPHACLLNRLFRRRSKKTSKLRVTGLCVWNSPGTGHRAQMASNAENVSIWWRLHGISTNDTQLCLWSVFWSGLPCNNVNVFCANIIVTVTSHERPGVSNHRSPWTWTWTWKMFIRQNSTQHVQEKLTIWMSNTLY